jgi:MSHA biogenesis protein MshN
MSLINQMLKDIDKRQGVNANTFSDTAGIRLEASRQASPAQRVLVWGGLVLVVVSGGYAIRQWMAASPSPAQPVVQAPALPSAQLPAPLTASSPEPAAQANVTKATSAPTPAAAPAPAVVAAADAAVPKSGPERKPEVLREIVREPVKPVAKAAKPKAEAADVAVASASALTAETTAKVPPKKEAPPLAVGTVSRQLSAEQRADNAYREAVSLLRQGRGAEAQKSLQHSLIDQPGHADARVLLARVWLDEGKLTEAKSLLTEGIALRPQSFALYSTLAHAQLAGKDVDSAVATLERGLPAAGENAEYQALLAAALQQQTRHAEAVQHYVTALRQLPDTPNWLVGLGVSLQATNNLSGAAEAYQRALDLGLPASLAQFARDKLSQLKR